MASFVSKLTRLTEAATSRGLVDHQTAKALVALAEERERGVLSLASALGWLGGGVVVLGVILLVAANWTEIGDGVKIAAFLLLLAGTHGIGLWIRWTERPYPRTAEALHFLGAGLFLAGVGLVAQIYHLDARPPNAILLWLVAVVPLVVLLRSAPITAMAIFALLLWAHMEGGYSGSPVQMPRSSFTASLMLEIGIGTALLGFSTFVRSREPAVSRVMRAAGIGLLFYGVYTLGFYRYFSRFSAEASIGSLILPTTALLLGAAGLAVGWNRMAPESPWLRKRVGALLIFLLVLAATALAADLGALPRGPDFEFFNFGGADRTFQLVELLISMVAWALWFLLALWCVAYGARSRRKAYLNAGVLGVGLGVVTRFFDLIGGQTQTGLLFLVGGLVLLATGWAMEKWRRAVVARMGETA